MQRALVPGTAATLAVIKTPMPGGGMELQFDVPSAFPSGSVLLTGHYLDNRWVPSDLLYTFQQLDGSLKW